MGDVVDLRVVSYLDLPSERIIKWAGEADLDHAVVLGWKKDGGFYFASSYAAAPEVLYLLEWAKKQLLEVEL